MSFSIVHTFWSGCSNFRSIGRTPAGAAAGGRTLAFCIAWPTASASLRASLIPSRTLIWNARDASRSRFVSPSRSTRGSAVSAKLRVWLWPPAVSVTVYLPGAAMGPPAPPFGAFGAHGPG